MKSISTLVTVAIIATAGVANAATPAKPDPVCAANQAMNATTIAKAQAAATPAERLAVLKAAIAANPGNAACLADLALQMTLSTGVNPAAGPEELGATTEVPTTTEGTTPPAENPSQLNQPTGTQSTSPATPSI